MQENDKQLKAAQQREATSLSQLRNFACRGLPPADLLIPEAGLDHQQAGPPLPETLAQCIEELGSLQPAKEFTEALMLLRGLVKSLEKRMRKMDPIPEPDGEGQAWLENLSVALQAHATVGSQAETVAGLAQASLPVELQQEADGSLSHASFARDTLITLQRRFIHSRLAALSWPPSLSQLEASDASSASANGAGDPPAVSPTPIQFSSMTNGLKAHGQGFLQDLPSPNGPPRPSAGGMVPAWRGFDAPQDLKVSDELKKALLAFIGMQRCVQQASFEIAVTEENSQDGPMLWAVEALAEPIAGTYHLPFELARALRCSVQEVLRTSWLPRLAAMADANLWLHFAEKAVEFERNLAPLRGLPIPPGSAEGAAAQVWVHGGCMEVVSEEEQWAQGWLGAEAAEAVAQVEAAVDSPSAWSPAEQAWDPAVSGSATWGESKLEEAWESEFWPPCCADSLLQLLRELAGKACWLPEGPDRQQFAAAVPLEAMKAFRTKMQIIGRTADEFGDLAGPVWAPRVSACICAARYMVQSLREPSPLLLTLDEELPIPNGKRRGRSLLDGEASSFESASRRWCLRMAKAVAEKFADETARYRRRSHLDNFASTGPRPGGPSRELSGGLDWLAGCLSMLSQHLDSVAFREVWRSAAIALNRLLYNDVATEAHFSSEGAEQFAGDCQALQAAFRRWTPRPGAHFRELTEACALLSMEPAAAAQLVASLHSQPADERGSCPALTTLQVARLSRDQALCVLERRIDLLPLIPQPASR
ncbi:hypothetical protein WJX84_011625 [Apatococcus fuscideae]|uniref:Rab3 GTPase-activating protein catalytic subunit n=1 Tax=Apatococcus fuscideae TaxID=2026836 RepID=A0AAW1SQG2_9CHLO